MGEYYTEQFKDLEDVILPQSKTEFAENIYWVYGMVLDKKTNISNREVVQLLAKEGIGCRTFFWCMHEQPVYTKVGMFQNEEYPNAELLARKGFYIPSGLALTKEQMKKVVETVKKVINSI